MTDVTLVLKGQNSDLVNKIKEVQKENQKLYDNSEKSQKRQVGLIADIEKELGRLQAAQKNAMSIEQIEKYNRKIAEAKQGLEEYNKAGVAHEKQTASMTQMIGKWALTLGGAAAALKIFKEAVLATTAGLNAFNIVGAVAKQVMADFVTGAGLSMQRISNAIAVQQRFNELRLEGYKEAFLMARFERQYQELYAQAIDQTLSKADKLKSIDKALAAHNKAVDLEIEHTKKAIEATEQSMIDQPGVEKWVKMFFELNAKLEDLEASRVSKTKRLISIRSGIIQDDIEKELKWRKDLHDRLQKAADEEIEMALNRQKKYQDLSLKLLDDYDKSNIESLTGVAKLKAQRDFGLKQIAELRKQLADIGTVTEEQDKMLSAMGANVWKAFYKGVVKEAKTTPEQKAAISKALLEGMPSANDIQKSFINTSQATKPIESIWQLIGIDPESDEGKKQIEAVNKVVDSTMNAIDDITQKKVEDAQRQRELLDTQISEKQAAIQQEIELSKAGFASNVTAKQKELDDLKKQRDIALKKEEEAVKQKRALDTISQVSSLITASAETLDAFNGPMLPIGIALIAAMFAAFAATKIKASQMAGFAKGGWTGDGTYRDGTGEKVAGVAHQEEFVVRRGPAHKFRDVLEAINRDDKRMIFNKFNKLDLAGGATVNNVMVENTGPNKRLDRLIQLNKKTEEVIELGNQTIIHKGVTTRVIKR